MKDFTYTSRGRSAAAMLAAAAWLAGLAVLWLVLKAALWIVLLLALPMLPALWDLLRDPGAGFTLGNRRADWRFGTRRAGAGFDEIDHVRLDTRWDFSVRVTFVLQDGNRLRLPPAATPPHRVLERELAARGLRCERHHFLVF